MNPTTNRVQVEEQETDCLLRQNLLHKRKESKLTGRLSIVFSIDQGPNINTYTENTGNTSKPLRAVSGLTTITSALVEVSADTSTCVT